MGRRRVQGVALVASVLIGSVFAQGGAGAAPASARPGAGAAGDAAMTDQIIVTYADVATSLDSAEAAEVVGKGARVTRQLGSRSAVVKLAAPAGGAKLAAAMDALAAQPGVVAVEPDAIMRTLDVPNDPLRPSQWALTNPAASGVYGINAAAAWDITTGAAGIRIAVLDSGYLDHADLAGRFVGGYDFIGDTRIANDGNGRDANAHDPGDWITSVENSSGFFAGCGVSNSSWHGTHVAGTIGAATNNALGMSGVNRVSQIVPVRVLGKCGGYVSDIVDGMRWAAGLAVAGVPANPNPARVVSMSLGGGGTCGASYQSAVNDVVAAGAVVVVAAGNSNSNAGSFTPASCAGVVTVAATGKAGNRSHYSNFGASVEIAAPGGDSIADGGDTILSTLNSGTTTPGGDLYGKYQGTSMATPHVSGVVSLMLSVNPGLTPAQVTSILQSSARPFPALSSCSGICGAGILDAAAAVAASSGGGSAPGAFAKASPANNSINRAYRPTLKWNVSVGATSYQVCLDTVLNSTCDTSWIAVSLRSWRPPAPLAHLTTHEWQVRAVNVGGTRDANGGIWWRFRTKV